MYWPFFFWWARIAPLLSWTPDVRLHSGLSVAVSPHKPAGPLWPGCCRCRNTKTTLFCTSSWLACWITVKIYRICWWNSTLVSWSFSRSKVISQFVDVVLTDNAAFSFFEIVCVCARVGIYDFRKPQWINSIGTCESCWKICIHNIRTLVLTQLKWDAAIINLIKYTCSVHLMACQKVCYFCRHFFPHFK